MKNITNLCKLNFRSTKTKQVSHQLFSHTKNHLNTKLFSVFETQNNLRNTRIVVFQICFTATVQTPAW